MKKNLLAILLTAVLIFGQNVSVCDEKFSQKTDRFSAVNIKGNLSIQIIDGSPVIEGNYSYEYPYNSDKKEGMEKGTIEQPVCYMRIKFDTSDIVYVALYPDKEKYRPSWSKLFISSPYEPSAVKLSANWYMSAEEAKELVEKSVVEEITVCRVVFAPVE